MNHTRISLEEEKLLFFVRRRPPRTFPFSYDPARPLFSARLEDRTRCTSETVRGEQTSGTRFHSFRSSRWEFNAGSRREEGERGERKGGVNFNSTDDAGPVERSRLNKPDTIGSRRAAEIERLESPIRCCATGVHAAARFERNRSDRVDTARENSSARVPGPWLGRGSGLDQVAETNQRISTDPVRTTGDPS